MTAYGEARVEALLREAATSVHWPATPDLRAAVVARIDRDGLAPGVSAAPGTLPSRAAMSARPAIARHPRMLRLARPLAVALVAVLLLAGVAAALGFRLPGLDLIFVERLPPAGTGLDLGSPAPLAGVRDLAQPRVLLPAALRAPDTAYVIGTGSTRIVTLAYRAEPGQPTLAGSDLALTIMAAPGRADRPLLAKLLPPGTVLDPVSIGGSPGWWISGAPHEIVVLRPDGNATVLRSALAGDTLVFNRDGTVFRLESALGRDATVAIAESMR